MKTAVLAVPICVIHTSWTRPAAAGHDTLAMPPMFGPGC